MKQSVQVAQLRNDESTLSWKDTIHDVRKHYSNSLEKIDTILRLHSRDLTSEKIHDLRVEIKRIRALFHLLKSTTPKFSERKYVRALNELFQNAGRLRSVQVEFDLINRNFADDQNTNYLHQLHEYKVKRHDSLDKLIERGIDKAVLKNKKEIDRFIKKLNPREINKYLKDQEKYISHLLKKNIFREERLHMIRKKLKRYCLNAKNIKAYTVTSPWEVLLELLGEWHDHQVALYQLLKAIHTGHLNPSETDHLNSVKLKLKKKKSELFEQIILMYTGRPEKDSTEHQYDLIIHHK